MIDRLSGVLLIATTILVFLAEASGVRLYLLAAGAAVILYLALVAPGVHWSRQIFVATGLGLFAAAALTLPDWPALAGRALASGAFIAAFFVAVGWLRNAAGTSPVIERCGRFLAEQPPGRRYLALTLGGQMFGLVLLYGAISLLGSLAESSARRESNAEVRAIRTRRMLLAVQRGFVTTLCWSPLTFSMAVSTSLVPDSSWTGAVGLCLISGLILAVLGWGMDAAFKPRLSGPRPPPRTPQGSWTELKPLLLLLVLLMGGVGALQAATGLRAVYVVMIFVPVLSLSWIALQGRSVPGGPLAHAARRGAGYVVHDLAGYRSEIVLLVMAGFIGTLGSGLLAPLVATAGLDLSAVPAWALLVGLVWVVPVTGQLGMNPILSVSLLAPLLPHAHELGISPNAIILAFTAGWALSGASSPFTATTLLVGALGRVSALHVGWKWNGAFTLVGGLLLSFWVAAAVLL
ncbi:MAG: hypothetical protein JSU82_09720 [Rhodospirillales bacterium]|nr:MAG: hypothetical protein JSU82_09720 [Rhodospirillales bacterium]